MFVDSRKVQAQTGRKQDFINAWHSAVGARLARQPGFVTVWLVTASQSDKIDIITQWHTEDDYHCWRRSTACRQSNAHIGWLTRKRIEDRSYQVEPQARPKAK